MISDPIGFERFKNSLFSVADEVALTIFPDDLFRRAEGQRGHSTAVFDAMFDWLRELVTQGLTPRSHSHTQELSLANPPIGA